MEGAGSRKALTRAPTTVSSRWHWLLLSSCHLAKPPHSDSGLFLRHPPSGPRWLADRPLLGLPWFCPFSFSVPDTFLGQVSVSHPSLHQEQSPTGCLWLSPITVPQEAWSPLKHPLIPAPSIHLQTDPHSFQRGKREGGARNQELAWTCYVSLQGPPSPHRGSWLAPFQEPTHWPHPWPLVFPLTAQGSKSLRRV